VSLLALIVELLLALAKLMGMGASSVRAHEERATGAALQREEDMKNEEARIAAAARAGLAVDRLPIGYDAEDRDRAP
jgi:hypothetical protein